MCMWAEMEGEGGGEGRTGVWTPVAPGTPGRRRTAIRETAWAGLGGVEVRGRPTSPHTSFRFAFLPLPECPYLPIIRPSPASLPTSC